MKRALRHLSHSLWRSQPKRLVCQHAAILKGNVPSPAEWKDAWPVLSETVSLRKGPRIYEKRQQKAETLSPATSCDGGSAEKEDPRGVVPSDVHLAGLG